MIGISRITIALIIGLFFGSSLWATDKVYSLAVLDFEGDANTSVAQRRALAKDFSTYLSMSPYVRLLDRSNMDIILEEQGFQQSGACNSSDCQLEIGRLLGTEKMIFGSVVKFGSLYVLGINLLDVETGAIESPFTIKIEGSLMDLVKEAPKLAAMRVSDALGGKSISADTTIVGMSEQSKRNAISSIKAKNKADKKSSTRKRVITTIGVTLGTLMLLGGGYSGIFYQRESNDEYKDYSAISGIRDSDQVAMDAGWTRVEKNENKRDNGLKVAGAGFLMVLGFSLMF